MLSDRQPVILSEVELSPSEERGEGKVLKRRRGSVVIVGYKEIKEPSFLFLYRVLNPKFSHILYKKANFFSKTSCNLGWIVL